VGFSLDFGGQAQGPESGDEGIRQALVGVQQGPGKARLARRGDDRVGQLVGVQDGAAPGRAADEVPDAGLEAGEVHVGERLGVAERETGRRPGVEPQGRERFAAPAGFEDGFVGGHVPRAAGGDGVKEQTPSVHSMERILPERGGKPIASLRILLYSLSENTDRRRVVALCRKISSRHSF
jgi:hypothetical protein